MKRTLLSLAMLLLGVGAMAQEISLKASMFYLTVLIATKTMVLQARNLPKIQHYFLEYYGEQKNLVAMNRSQIS